MAFFRHEGPDCEGRYLRDMRGWSFERMETCHDYIQWMFPTETPSNFNPTAPLLTPDLQAVFSSDSGILEELRLNLRRFCLFLVYGMAVVVAVMGLH